MARELSDYSMGELRRMRQRALENSNAMAFGELSEQIGIDPEAYSEFSHEKNLWDRYIAERMWLADRTLANIAPKPVLDLPADGGGVRYKIDTYVEAGEIVGSFSRNERYLRGLVARVTENTKFADSLDYRGLLHQGFKIRGIADKILGSRK